MPSKCKFPAAIITFGSLCRLGLLVDVIGPAVFSKYFQSAAVRSVLYNPKYTLENLKEVNFIYDHFRDHNKFDSYAFIQTAAKKLLPLVPKGFDQVSFCLLAMLLDLAIACQLYRLARRYYDDRNDYTEWESKTENRMKPSIHPTDQKRNLWFASRSQDTGDDFSLRMSVAIYYLNPTTLMTSSGGNIQGICVLFLVSSFTEAVQGNAISSGLYLAVLCHVDIVNIIFLIPSALLWKHCYKFGSNNLIARRPSTLCKCITENKLFYEFFF